MTSRISSKNIEKKAKRKKIVVKKDTKQKSRVEPGLSARASNPLTTAPQ